MSAVSVRFVGDIAKNIGKALRELAEPCDRSEKIHDMIARSARRCGLDQWRVFNLWYGKARRIEQREWDAITDALQKKREQETRNELHELKLRLARIEARLVQTDPDFHRLDIDALRSSLRGRG